MPGRPVRRRRTAGRPREDQRSGICQQRVVRRLRRGGADARLPGRQAGHDPGHAAGTAGRPARGTAVRRRRQRDDRCAAGTSGVQQPLRDGRHRGPGPSSAPGSRCARRGRRDGGQRAAGGRPAPRQAHHRPARADRADRRDYRQLGTDPGRHRRRGRLPAGTRALRDPSRRAAGPGAKGPSRRASAQGHHQLVPPAAPGVVAARAAVGRRARGPLAGHRGPSGQVRAGTGCGPLTSG